MIDTGINRTVWSDPLFTKQFMVAEERYRLGRYGDLTDTDIHVLDQYYGNAEQVREKRTTAWYPVVPPRPMATTAASATPIAVYRTGESLDDWAKRQPEAAAPLAGVITMHNVVTDAIVQERQKRELLRMEVDQCVKENVCLLGRVEELERALKQAAGQKGISVASECREHVPGRIYKVGEFCWRKGSTWQALTTTALTPGLAPEEWKVYARGVEKP